ncbi:hypothetical protein SB659_18905, partial [Arthrobacter sp. SIMBA_036]|uniref:hypothetical protein n=1 Tax=Arthrobacter sp. SIMBA_036 TaxID=3085778 RepID=UPI00397AC184
MGKEQAMQEAVGWLSRSAAGQGRAVLPTPSVRGSVGAGSEGPTPEAPRRRTQQERREEAEGRLLSAALTL